MNMEKETMSKKSRQLLEAGKGKETIPPWGLYKEAALLTPWLILDSDLQK